MKLKFFLFVLLALHFFHLKAQQFASGFVYEDTNRNNLHDTWEKGLSGVAVSNGEKVVITDTNGKYYLPVQNDNILFVIKPVGYMVPVDENMLPKFYYIHKPEGSPDLKYSGVEPTGDLPGSVDFALLPVNEVDNFKVLLFGDPQVYNKNQLHYFDQRIVSELTGIKDVLFGISMGDLVGDNPTLFKPYNKSIKKIGIPWYNVIGNHDMNYDVRVDSLSDESFEGVYGPSTYSFNYGKAHFIVLKDILRPDPRGESGYWGGLTSKQLTFLKSDLELVPHDRLIVLLFHIPIWEGYIQKDIFRDVDREALFTLLKDFPNTLSVSAHTHIQINKLMSEKEDWKQEKPHHHLNLGTTCGSWYRGELDSNGIARSTMADGTPQGYAFLSVDGNHYAVDYKVAGEPDDYQMNIYNPRFVAQGKRSSSPVYVNFFIGSEQDKVMFKVDDGKWKPMTYTIEQDPSYLHLLDEWDFADHLTPGVRPVEPRECYHLWKSVLPAALDSGKHEIVIKATDMFGKTHYGRSFYNIQ